MSEADSKFEEINRLSAEGPLVKVRVNGNDAVALVNTGFEASVIDGDCAKSLGVEITPAGVNRRPGGELLLVTATGCHVDIEIPSVGVGLPGHPCRIGDFSREVGGKTLRAPYDVILSRDALAGKIRFVYNGIEGQFDLNKA